MVSKIYTVYATRYNEPSGYIVGVFGKKLAAMKAAEAEEAYRGNKYVCEIREWALNSLRGSSKIIERN